MKDLTVGKESRLIWRFAIPMLIGNVFQQLYNVVDSIVVGKFIGDEALAAVGASFPVLFVLISLTIGITTGATIVVSQFFGAKDNQSVKRTIDTVFIFIFWASIILTLIGFILSSYIFKWLALPEEIIPEATLYFRIYVSGILLMFGFYGTSAVLRGLGDSKTPLYFMIISTLLIIVLDVFFVIVLKMGVEGVAIATVISHGVTFIGSIVYLNKFHPLIRFSFRKLVFDKIIFIKSLRIGIPTGMQQTFVSLGMLALMRIVSDFGTETIAAYTVAGRLDMFAAMPAMNFSMALTSFVGQNIGANQIERVRKGFVATLKMTSIVSITMTATFFLLGEPIMRIFTNDSEVVAIGVSYLRITSLFYLVFSSMFVTHGVLRGAGDTLIPMFITLISLWVLRVPFSYFLSRESFGLGSDGIWWGIPIAWTAGFCLSYIYYKTGRWKRKAIIKHPVIGEI
ncbi:MAG: MATE family efflux transporter [Bacteroidetes bacterium]|nr:MATE family efflux transporter [Bacteroidota bacterium]